MERIDTYEGQKDKKEETSKILESSDSSESKDNGKDLDLLSARFILETPRVIIVPRKVYFYHKETSEKVKTYALEVQCQHSDVAKVTKCFDHFHKQENTCQFIPYLLKREEPGEYTKWMKLQNTFLDQCIWIPIFGLNPLVLSMPVKHTKETTYCKELKESFVHFQDVFGLQETNKTEELGKWLLITNEKHEKEVRNFIDYQLPLFSTLLTYQTSRSICINISHILVMATTIDAIQLKQWQRL